jgi:hypothetical protein
MRCPKCGYISFDYNIICPKCNKDIASEQRMLNLPSYRPDPPRLLDVLIGMPDESQQHFPIDDEDMRDEGTIEHDMGLGLESLAQHEGTEEIDLSMESPEVESSDSEKTEDFALEEIADLPFDSSEPAPPPPPKESEEEITLDLDDISVEEAELSEAVAAATGEREALKLDLDDRTVEKTAPKKKAVGKGGQFDEAEMITVEIDRKKMNNLEEEELEDLDLDDLDLDEPEKDN